MALDVINPFGFLHGAASLKGVISQASTPNVKSAAASGTYTFAPGFRMTIAGGVLTFRSNDTYVLTSDVSAAILAAASAAGSTATSV